MADKKISELNAALTISDSDDFAVVQAAETKQVNASVIKTYISTAPTISGGTIDNAVIGGSTAVAGTFTALTSSSTTTLNGTTIPASKTLVSTDASQTLTNKTISGSSNTLSNIGNSSLTNSSITFGSTATSLGGTVSALNGVSIGASSASTGNFTTLGATGNVTLGDASGDTVTLNAGTVTLNNSTTISAASTKTLTLNGGAGSNGLVLDASNNVGIGTGTPGVASGYTTLDVNNATNGARIRCLVNGIAYGGMYTNGTTDFRIGSLAAVPLNIITGSNTIATFDTSGNLGLGVTPSAWNSGVKAFQVLNTAAWSSGNDLNLSSNAYYGSGGWAYIASSTAAAYQLSGGAHYWLTAPSGTAGNAISFTQSMTLDASGNLLVGCTGRTFSTERAEFVGASGTGGTAPIITIASGQTTGIAFTLGVDTTNNWSWQGNLLQGTGAVAHRFYSYTTYAGSYSTAGAWFQGNNSSSWSTTSDARVKTNVETLQGGLDIVLALRPVSFYNLVTEQDEVNFIAQEYETVLPSQVIDDKPVEKEVEYCLDGVIKRLNRNLDPYLVKAIQELSAEIETLKAKVN